MFWLWNISQLRKVRRTIVPSITHLYHMVAETIARVDRDQAVLFMDEYRRSSDKKQFISDKQKQCLAILQACWIFYRSLTFLTNFQQHAKKCQAWQKKRELERKDDQKRRQRDRSQRFASLLDSAIITLSRRRIFQLLDQNGYSREIGYFGCLSIQRSRESDFRTSKPLTDKGQLPSIHFIADLR